MAKLKAQAISVLLSIARRARHAQNKRELEFMLVNDTYSLIPYRQAVLWLENGGVQALSGVMEIDANAPYIGWLKQFFKAMDRTDLLPRVIDVNSLPPQIKSDLDDWLPRQLLWLPIADKQTGQKSIGGLLLAQDLTWQQHEIDLLAEWVDIWQNEYFKGANTGKLKNLFKSSSADQRPWWKRRAIIIPLLIVMIGAIPIKLNILAPAELIAASPHVVSSPSDGVINEFHVKPNEIVKEGDLLFSLKDSTLQGRLDIARQELATAEAAYRQNLQMALYDPKAKSQLPTLAGRIGEQRAQVASLKSQLQRTRVFAKHDGVALFDDPTEWIGKPVSTGEPVMRIAEVDDKEIEVWVAVADAIPISDQTEVILYLSASPLQPIEGEVRYMAYEAVERPDGNYAYRVRAKLREPTSHRLGLKGTARIEGERVAIAYWVFRRPWAVIRQYLGL
jgi:hypothetical protein